MRRSLRLLGAFGAGVVLTLAGCSDADDDPAAEMTKSMRQPEPPPQSATSEPGESPTADSENVAWMEQLCGQMGKLAALADVTPPDVEPGDIEGQQQALGKIVDRFDGTLTSFLSGLRDLPSAPESSGDQVTQDMIDMFDPVKEGMADIGDDLDAAAPDDDESVVDAMDELKSVLSSLQDIDEPLEELDGTSLAAAAQQSSECRELGGLGDESGTVPTK